MKNKLGRPKLSSIKKSFGEYTVNNRGWVHVKCPFCKDGNKHFGIAPEGNGFCLRCGTKRDRYDKKVTSEASKKQLGEQSS